MKLAGLYQGLQDRKILTRFCIAHEEIILSSNSNNTVSPYLLATTTCRKAPDFLSFFFSQEENHGKEIETGSSKNCPT